MQKLKKLSITF